MNDTNVSSTAVTDKTTRLMYGSISYAILGVCVFALNFPIFLAVMMYKKLREKEYIIVAGLALSDAIDGATYVVVGVSRVFLFLNHQGKPETDEHFSRYQSKDDRLYCTVPTYTADCSAWKFSEKMV